MKTKALGTAGIRNCQPLNFADVPIVAMNEFRRTIIAAVRAGCRISSLFGLPDENDRGRIVLVAVLSDEEKSGISVLAAAVAGSYPALTPDCPQAAWFERELWEQWGIVPEHHPFLKPIRFQPSYVNGRKSVATEFYRITGLEVHEVAVGPVHAGVIEPGHFRFQCHGENVYTLEISLGYQHRGIEPALVGGPDKKSVHYIETAAGDTTAGHTTAYCQALETLAHGSVSPFADAIRGLAVELERVANHVGDLGALAGDVGYLPTQSFCGRLRGDFLNLTALLCGNRFSRGLIRPGGVAFADDRAVIAEMARRIEQLRGECEGAIALLWDEPSVMARFENTGTVSETVCRDLGLVGPVARASGVIRDVRRDFPVGVYQFHQIPVMTQPGGDVFSRAFVRWEEIDHSLNFIKEQLKYLPTGPSRQACGPLRPRAITVSLVEGWRGEICHTVITDSAGNLRWYKIVDPSFHNWLGLAQALRRQPISDFPLCNKSFNLSYCGHDL